MSITTPIFNMFAKSPIKPLQEHMHKANACVEHLLPFFKAVLKQDWKNAKEQQRHISNLEKDADHLKKNLRLHLPKGLFLPVARRDILEILNNQDRIANKAEDIAGLILGRKLCMPDAIAKGYLELLRRCIDASKQATTAINELDELLETGFRGNEVKLLEKMIHQLDAIEHDTDKMQVDTRKQLFAIEEQLSPINAMFLYKIIEWTGDLADRAQTVGAQLQLLIARS